MIDLTVIGTSTMSSGNVGFEVKLHDLEPCDHPNERDAQIRPRAADVVLTPTGDFVWAELRGTAIRSGMDEDPRWGTYFRAGRGYVLQLADAPPVLSVLVEQLRPLVAEVTS